MAVEEVVDAFLSGEQGQEFTLGRLKPFRFFSQSAA
ncbi:MAG: hypothetical protein M2R46_03141 [Verrucomicrobia subdivision 3 bacterium]|nr:hypothetical protein [Limisphaerales bacterium]